MRKHFTKKAGRLQESDFNTIRKILEIGGITPKQVADITGWQRGTVYMVRNVPTWEKYLENRQARLLKIKGQLPPVSPPANEDITLVSRTEYNGLVKNLEQMSQLLLNIAQIEKHNTEVLSAIQNALSVRSKEKLAEIFGF